MTPPDPPGPVLQEVSPDDDNAVRALLAEQRALLSVIRSNRIWQWLGGVPAGFGDPRRTLYGTYCALCSLCLAAITLIVAGFTRGISLWLAGGSTLACLVAWRMLIAPPANRTLAYFRRAKLLPAVVVAYEPEACDPDDGELRCITALVGKGVEGADDLKQLLQQGRQLRSFVNGKAEPPAPMQPLVATIRERLARRDHNGSRVPLPPGDEGYELAFLLASHNFLTGGALTSRLLFVLADPDHRSPERTRVVQCEIWGGGAESLCGALPLEGAA